jgi:protein-tyrosine kinase
MLGDVTPLRAMKVLTDSEVGNAQDAAAQLNHHVEATALGRSIGDLIREARNLDPGQIEQVLQYQRQHRVPFGEAAIALKFATRDDVLWALGQQFHYPYAAEGDVANLNQELITAIDPFSDESEIFRDVRSQLLSGVMAPDLPPRALAVLSPDVGDGKTFFAANLAVAFSQLGGRTLLVDADMRTPRLHDLFDVPGGAGLSNILAGRADTNVIHESNALPGVFVLPVGVLPPNPLELVQRQMFGLLVLELCAKFDHVIVDTPAATHGADARLISAKCGAAMVIGRRGHSRMDAIEVLVSQVQKSHARFAGVMINEH